MERIASLRALRRLDEAEQVLNAALARSPRSPRLLAERGHLLYDQGQYEKALEACEQTLSVAPGSEDALMGRAFLLRVLRRFDEAEQALNAALALHPRSPQLLNERGWLHYTQGQYGQALEGFLRTLSVAPTSEEALEGRAASLRKLRRFDEAEQVLGDALARYPRSTKLFYERGALHYDQGQYARSLELCEQILSIAPGNEDALVGRAVSLRMLRRFDEAEQALNDALSLHPQSPRLLGERGNLLAAMARFGEAEVMFARAMAAAPTWLEPAFNRAMMLTRLGRGTEGLKLVQELERRFPASPELMVMLGWFHIRRNEPWKARGRFEALPEDSEAREHGLGTVSFLLQDYAEAELHFDRARALNPRSAVHQTNLAWALMRQGDDASLKRAEELCHAVLRIDPEFPQAFNCLGLIAFQRGNFREAEEWFSASIRANPTEGSYSDLGALYLQAGRYPEARKQFDRALELDPNDLHARLELGNLHWQLGEKQEAIQELRRALAIDPESAESYRSLSVVLMRAGEFSEAESVLRKGLQRLDEPRRARLHLTLAQVLRTVADQSKDRLLYEEAYGEVQASLRRKQETESYFELGLILAKLDDYAGALAAFQKCGEQHIEAQRNAARVRAVLEARKVQARGSRWGSWLLGVGTVVQVLIVWAAFYLGRIGEKTLVAFIPILLALCVVAALLPWLTHLKMPGVEVVLSQPQQAISPGPIGDLALTSSIPSITPGPR